MKHIGSDNIAYEICGRCQRFFEQNGKGYCEKCDDELKLSRNTINNYLEKNPRSSIIDIVKETGVKLKDVNVFLESGGASISSEKETVNLRHEEIKKENKNKFIPRSLGR